MCRLRTYHAPEDLGPEQARRDAAIPNRRFYVYVLQTDYGHYVGHTARLEARLREHRDGESASTAGGNPRRAWVSAPFSRRHEAASFEAALKSLRDQRAPRFTEITGLEPLPFVSPARRPWRTGGRQRRPPVRHGRRGRRWRGRRAGGFGGRFAWRMRRRFGVALLLLLLLYVAIDRMVG